jgi:hypothetical protein
MDASTVYLDHTGSPPEQTLEMYGELLGCARRMLRIARTRRWQNLMTVEVEFVRVYEQIAANEAVHAYNGEQADLREVFLSEIFSRVESTRSLLNERQQQLAQAKASPVHDHVPIAFYKARRQEAEAFLA